MPVVKSTRAPRTLAAGEGQGHAEGARRAGGRPGPPREGVPFAGGQVPARPSAVKPHAGEGAAGLPAPSPGLASAAARPPAATGLRSARPRAYPRTYPPSWG